MHPVLRKALLAASIPVVAVSAVLWASSVWQTRRDEGEIVREVRKARFKLWNTPLDAGRCAISVANFGGGKARLVRAEKDGTIHFAVVESAQRTNPLSALQQGDWLKAQFGTAETTTLGTFISKEAALARAGQLCPPKLRCLPGRPGCKEHPSLPSPFEMFSGTLVPVPLEPAR